jgi:F1F0 ATPase subunit 2
MSEAFALVQAAVVGGLLGGLFFGGLWQTVPRALVSRQPALWFVGSMLIRTALTLSGFYLLSRGRPEWLVVALCGFVVAQLIATRRARLTREKPLPLAGEATDAP